MYLDRHFQNAYVTRNLDKAVALIKKQYGLEDFIYFDPEIQLETPKGTFSSSVKVAIAWVGSLQFEFIEPVGGLVSHYADYLPDDENDFSPVFNHICMRRNSLDEMKEEIGKLGLPILFESGIEGMGFIYVDARESLGHYLEYMWCTPEAWEMIGGK